MILLRELTDGNRLLMGRTDRQQEGLVTTRTQGPTREAHRCRHLTAAEVQHRHTTRTPAPMLRPDKDRALTLSGVVPTFHAETRALPWVITQPQTARLPEFQGQRAETPLGRVPSGVTLRSAKLPAAICTPGTMAMCTRLQVMAGRNTITEAGIP
jgi:hypothetical protein